ncbi:MAG: SDR family oxidoreductase [Chlorobi bacterium]|nr:SDR family oxidoreductase [Chlorobiota bacterium]
MKTILITGASSGIGRELARVYAEKNNNLFITARRGDKLKELKGELEAKHNISVDYFPLDLSQPASAEILYAKTSELSLKVDILINNAGFGIYDEFLDSELLRNEMMLNLNILSLTKLSHFYASDMIARGGGQIVNISSMAAFQPVPFMATYAASKAYVLSFSEALAYELKPKNVFVTAICPGATRSEFGDTAGFKSIFESKGVPSSRDLAIFAYKAVKKKKVMAMHGAKNSFMAFGQRFVPRFLVTKITASIIKE